MNDSQKVLSDLVVFSKYARFRQDLGRRETWFEIVDRYVRMMLVKYTKVEDVQSFDWQVSLLTGKQDRVFNKEYYTEFAWNIVDNAAYLYRKDVLPSMRAAQFAGPAIEKNEARIYNCAFAPVDHPAFFSEAMFLLLGGTGFGYSVQFAHVARLPKIQKGNKQRKFLIGDSIEGWADSIKALMYWGFGKRESQPIFDYSDIREKGEPLITAGGKAPGPAPLIIAHGNILQILENKRNGEKLTPLECHDIICHIADAVLAGGIRRAALIALFSADDEEMMQSKGQEIVTFDSVTYRDGEKEGTRYDVVGTYKGMLMKGVASQYEVDEQEKTGKTNWWVFNAQRGRSNNSAVLLRHRVTKEFFNHMWSQISNSYSGEPGIYFSNDASWGTNPCVEIALRPFQFCNLTEINAGSIRESCMLDGEVVGIALQTELNNRAKVAAFFGTLQAGFTDFHYLRDIWRETTEKDALIGVGMTGIASGDTLDLNLTEASTFVDEENKRVAAIIGIKEAARKTTIKPSGTTSIVVGSSSGIHAWHDEYYLRSMQVAIGSDLANYFFEHHPALIKVMERDPKSAVIGIPQHAPENAILRASENAIQMLDRVFKYYDEWVKPGHVSGSNTNNVSATVYVDRTKKWAEDITLSYPNIQGGTFDEKAGMTMFNEWEVVGEYLWENREKFNGMAVLPYDGGNYTDAPFQTITKERFDELYPLTQGIDLTLVKELDDNTDLSNELACAGGNCEVK